MDNGGGKVRFVLTAMINSYLMPCRGKFADHKRSDETRTADYKDSQEGYSSSCDFSLT